MSWLCSRQSWLRGSELVALGRRSSPPPLARPPPPLRLQPSGRLRRGPVLLQISSRLSMRAPTALPCGPRRLTSVRRSAARTRAGRPQGPQVCPGAAFIDPDEPYDRPFIAARATSGACRLMQGAFPPRIAFLKGRSSRALRFSAAARRGRSSARSARPRAAQAAVFEVPPVAVAAAPILVPAFVVCAHWLVAAGPDGSRADDAERAAAPAHGASRWPTTGCARRTCGSARRRRRSAARPSLWRPRSSSSSGAGAWSTGGRSASSSTRCSLVSRPSEATTKMRSLMPSSRMSRCTRSTCRVTACRF